MEENKDTFLTKKNTQLKQKVKALLTCSKEKDQLISPLMGSLSKQKQADTVT